MNLNTNLDIYEGLTELKLMPLATISNSFSNLSNTNMPIMPTSGVSRNL